MLFVTLCLLPLRQGQHRCVSRFPYCFGRDAILVWMCFLQRSDDPLDAEAGPMEALRLCDELSLHDEGL